MIVSIQSELATRWGITIQIEVTKHVIQDRTLVALRGDGSKGWSPCFVCGRPELYSLHCMMPILYWALPEMTHLSTKLAVVPKHYICDPKINKTKHNWRASSGKGQEGQGSKELRRKCPEK